MTYRVFSNDRGKIRGVPMYSCLTILTAGSKASAELKAQRRYRAFGPPDFAPIKAIEWPPASQASKDWLARHVGDRHCP